MFFFGNIFFSYFVFFYPTSFSRQIKSCLIFNQNQSLPSASLDQIFSSVRTTWFLIIASYKHQIRTESLHTGLGKGKSVKRDVCNQIFSWVICRYNHSGSLIVRTKTSLRSSVVGSAVVGSPDVASALVFWNASIFTLISASAASYVARC